MIIEMDRPIGQVRELQRIENGVVKTIVRPVERPTTIKINEREGKQPPVTDYAGERSFKAVKNIKRSPLSSEDALLVTSVAVGEIPPDADPTDYMPQKKETPVCGCTKKKKTLILGGVLLAGVLIGKSI